MVFLPTRKAVLFGSKRQALHLTATTTGAAQTVTLQQITHSVPTAIDWGDGTVEAIAAEYTGTHTHEYATADTYNIRIAKASAITMLDLRDSAIGGLNTRELRGGAITHFQVTAITDSTFDSADMASWTPTDWRLRAMPAGTYVIDSADMASWTPTTWYLYDMPAGTYAIDSADMASWTPATWVLRSMPAGTYAIDSADMASWTPTTWWLYSMPAADSSYTFAASCMRNWTPARAILCNDLGLATGVVDTIINDVWEGKATYTYGTPELNVGGTNDAPGGTYQDNCPPASALEQVYDLANGNCTPAGPEWSVIWNGGSAP